MDLEPGESEQGASWAISRTDFVLRLLLLDSRDWSARLHIAFMDQAGVLPGYQPSAA